MANLSTISGAVRKIVKVFSIGIAAIVLLIVIFQIGSFALNLISPTPPAPPTVAFGKLSLVSFPQNANSALSYSLNTLTGSLPQLPDRITVYKLQQPAPNLLGLDKAKSIAVEAGFTADPVALSETQYRWDKTDPLPTSLTMDIQSFDFALTSDYKNNDTVKTAAHLPDESLAQTASKEFFNKVMPLPDYIDDNKTKVTLLSINGNTLLPATSISTTQLIRIDYFPNAIDNLPIYTSNPANSLIYSLIASGTADYPQVVEAVYYHRSVTKDKATYPIKSASDAYEELKQGKGYIAANPTESSNIVITNVSLGYYIDPSSQQYLWPIIVFQGDKGFYAYVSAVSNNWIK